MGGRRERGGRGGEGGFEAIVGWGGRRTGEGGKTGKSSLGGVSGKRWWGRWRVEGEEKRGGVR